MQLSEVTCETCTSSEKMRSKDFFWLRYCNKHERAVNQNDLCSSHNLWKHVLNNYKLVKIEPTAECGEAKCESM